MSRKINSSALCWLYRSASSTGSPASRRLTKLIPFTTRPAVTSRQGMIRLASMLSHLHEIANDLQSDRPRLLRMKLYAEAVAVFKNRRVWLGVSTGSRSLRGHRNEVAVREV